MDKVDPKILERIRKMLAMAEGKANINESAVAASMAAKLMAKYNIDHADVLLRTIEDDDIVANSVQTENKEVPAWMGAMVVPVARLNDCEARYWYERCPTTGARLKRVQYLGQRDDAQVAAWIFSYLCDEVLRLSKVYRRQKRKEFGGGGHGTIMSDYRMGLVEEIKQTITRMREEKRVDLAQHSTGTALVVRKQAMILEKFQVKYSQTRGSSVRDGGAYYDGRRDGKNIRINGAVGHDRRGALS
jgi:hypothetical protein